MKLKQAVKLATVAGLASVYASAGFAAIASYSEDFESLVQTDPAALSGAGWLVGANVWNDAALTSFAYNYFAYPAPNGGPAFSGVDIGQGGAAQGAQQLVAYSDYNNGDHGSGKYIQAHLFQEQAGAIDASDVGKTYTFSWDQKTGNLAPPTTSDAFIKVVQTSGATPTFAELGISSRVTHPYGQNWSTNFVSLTIDASMVGETIQYGFRNVATGYQSSGMFYDNLNFNSAAPPVPVPAAAWLFGSALAGLVAVRRKK